MSVSLRSRSLEYMEKGTMRKVFLFDVSSDVGASFLLHFVDRRKEKNLFLCLLLFLLFFLLIIFLFFRPSRDSFSLVERHSSTRVFSLPSNGSAAVFEGRSKQHSLLSAVSSARSRT